MSLTSQSYCVFTIVGVVLDREEVTVLVPRVKQIAGLMYLFKSGAPYMHTQNLQLNQYARQVRSKEWVF